MDIVISFHTHGDNNVNMILNHIFFLFFFYFFLCNDKYCHMPFFLLNIPIKGSGQFITDCIPIFYERLR